MNLWVEKCGKCGTQNACDLGDMQDYTILDITGMKCRNCEHIMSQFDNVDLDEIDDYVVDGSPLSDYLRD